MLNLHSTLLPDGAAAPVLAFPGTLLIRKLFLIVSCLVFQWTAFITAVHLEQQADAICLLAVCMFDDARNGPFGTTWLFLTWFASSPAKEKCALSHFVMAYWLSPTS